MTAQDGARAGSGSDRVSLFLAALTGLAIGFLSGLMGKGGSAIATPLLHVIGFPAIIAVASPLPATVPSTMIASYAYSEQHLVDWRVVRWSICCGVPATALGALTTRWVDGGLLVRVTDVVLIALGLRLLVAAYRPSQPTNESAIVAAWELAVVATAVGVISGLLANSGGFLLAPLFITALKLPIKSALASSLAVSSVLAIPGTIVHASLGHINWTLVLIFGSTSVPLAFLGARTAMRIAAHRLERGYGVMLVVMGAAFLVIA